MSQTKEKKASEYESNVRLFLKLLHENLNSWIFDHHMHSDLKLGISFGNLLILDSYGKYGTKCDRLFFLDHTVRIIENKDVSSKQYVQ